jgi:hypothetical protein
MAYIFRNVTGQAMHVVESVIGVLELIAEIFSRGTESWSHHKKVSG